MYGQGVDNKAQYLVKARRKTALIHELTTSSEETEFFV